MISETYHLSDAAATSASGQRASGAGAASSANQRFIYNTSTGALFFDADGNQTGFGTVQIATLSNRPMIGANDISVRR